LQRESESCDDTEVKRKTTLSVAIDAAVHRELIADVKRRGISSQAEWVELVLEDYLGKKSGVELECDQLAGLLEDDRRWIKKLIDFHREGAGEFHSDIVDMIHISVHQAMKLRPR
jgi:hypothetical protein